MYVLYKKFSLHLINGFIKGVFRKSVNRGEDGFREKNLNGLFPSQSYSKTITK